MVHNLNRSNINLHDYHHVEEVLPSHIVSSHEQFVNFLNAYYEYTHSDELYYEIIYTNDDNEIIDDIIFLTKDQYLNRVSTIENDDYELETERQRDLDRLKYIQEPPTKLLHEIINARDVNIIDEELLENIQYELLLGDEYLSGFSNKRITAKLSNYLYRSKGTLFSIKQFFKMFFNSDVEVSYPKENIFIVGNEYDREAEHEQYRLFHNHLYTIDRAFDDLINGVSTKWTLFLNTAAEDNNPTGPFSYRRYDILRQGLGASYEDNAIAYREWLVNQQNENRNRILLNLFYQSEDFSQYPAFDYRPKSIVKQKASKIGYDSQKFLTDDKLYQIYSILIKSSIGYKDWKDAYKAFVHPAGLYVGAELHIQSLAETPLTGSTLDADVVPINVHSSVQMGLNPIVDATGLIPDASGNTMRILLPGSIDYYDDYYDQSNAPTLNQLNTTYDTIEEFINITSKTFDEDITLTSTNTTFSEEAQSLSTFDEEYYPYINPLDQIYIDENDQLYRLDENGNRIYI